MSITEARHKPRLCREDDMRKCRQRGGRHLARTRLSVNDVRDLVEAQNTARDITRIVYKPSDETRIVRAELIEMWRGIPVARTTYPRMYRRMIDA